MITTGDQDCRGPEAGAVPRTDQCVLVKPVSAACNLACRYCFYRQRPSDPYRNTTPGTMAREVLASLVAQHLRLAGPVASFAWQGGEPTLAGLDFFRQVVSFQSRYGASGQVVANALQTNGLALDRDWARFLAEYRFLVGVSLDGPAEWHDPWRADPSGRGSFAPTLAALRLLRRYGVETNVLAVVHRYNAGLPEFLLDFFCDTGLRHLQFVPALDRGPDGSFTEYSLSSDQYGEFLCRLFDAWYNGGRPQVSIRLFDNLVAIAAGQGSHLCELGGGCGSYYVVEYNGDVYPCDFFVAEPYELGNLVHQPLPSILAGVRRRGFEQARQSSPPECLPCRWQPICRSGCLRYRYAADGSVRGKPAVRFSATGSNYFCGAMRTFLSHTWARVELLAETARLLQPPIVASTLRRSST